MGLGKLGAPLAACLAAKGIPTIGVDSDARKVKAVSAGRAPVCEPRLQEMMRMGRGRLTATSDGEAAVMASSITFIVVPTPSGPGGRFSTKFVLPAARTIARALARKKGYHLVALTSTVMPGTTERELKPFLEAHSGKKCGRDFGLCYSPEFIALGSVVRDLCNPDFILLGESDPRAGRTLARVYRTLCDNHPRFARTNFVNAELAKLAVNTFVTAKISFANLLARLCERLPGADVDAVTAAVGMDSRIGSKYLKGAIGYGGPCFPRDNLALAALANAHRVPSILPRGTDTFNRGQVRWLAELVKSQLPRGKKVGILGLSYKPESDVTEESQGVFLAEQLAKDGVAVIAYDPIAMDNARRVLGRSIQWAGSAQECFRKSNVVVIATPWKEFRKIRLSSGGSPRSPKSIFDCWRMLRDSKKPAGLRYFPLGIGGLVP